MRRGGIGQGMDAACPDEVQPLARSQGVTGDRAVAPCRDEVLTALIGMCADRDAGDDIIVAALESVVASLELGGATLSLVHEHDGGLNLEPIAAVGSHAVFAREMSARPLASLADAATAVADGRTIFLGESTGPVGPSGPVTGVGRWRSAVNTHATAIAPVKAWGATLGVLTLEWPHSGPVGDRDRAVIEAVAGVFGLMVHEVQGRPGNRVSVSGHTQGIQRAHLVLTGQGVILPDVPDVPGERGAMGDAFARVSVAAQTCLDAQVVPFWDVVSIGAGRVAVSLGRTTAPSGGAHALAETCSQALRTLAVQGVSPATSLGYLSSTVRATASAAGCVDVVASSVDLSGAVAVVTYAAAGDALVVVVARDGTVTTQCSASAPVTGSLDVRPAEHHLIVLPGEHVAIVSLQAAEEQTVEIGAALGAALAGLPAGDDASQPVSALIDNVAAAGGVLVLSVIEASDTGPPATP